MQPSVLGTVPPARGVHTATVVGDHLVIYGGSSDFDQETMQCQQYYKDCHVVPTGTTSAGQTILTSSRAQLFKP